MTRRRRKKANAQAPSRPQKIPPGALPADTTKWAPNNSYSSPPPWYVDLEFQCVDCGAHETWTAEQQKWYFEEAGGSLYATAVRCHSCRQKRRQCAEQQREHAHSAASQPSRPLEDPDRILQNARKAIERAIAEAGFLFEERRRQPADPWTYILYCRDDGVLQLRWNGDCLCFYALCEGITDGNSDFMLITRSDMSDLASPEVPGAAGEVRNRIRRFATEVKEFCQLLKR